MTWEELVRAYIRMFVLVMETAGDQTGNSTYKEVQHYIDENPSGIQQLIDNDEAISFEEVILFLISLIVLNVHGDKVVSDKLIEFDVAKSEEAGRLIDDLYQRYLKGPTDAFMKKNGMPPVEDKISNIISTIFYKQRQ